MFVDSHCHLDFPELSENLPAVLDAMAANRVTHALCISVNLPALPQVLQIAADQFYYIGTSTVPNMYGVVKNDFRNVPEKMIEAVAPGIVHPEQFAIGQ